MMTLVDLGIYDIMIIRWNTNYVLSYLWEYFHNRDMYHGYLILLATYVTGILENTLNTSTNLDHFNQTQFVLPEVYDKAGNKNYEWGDL